jgi:hypothetical protein
LGLAALSAWLAITIAIAVAAVIFGGVRPSNKLEIGD